MDDLTELDELHLWWVVSFVVMGADPPLFIQILWLIFAIGFYFITPGGDGAPAQEGIGGQAT